jgi:hypothetical protein
MSECDLNIRRFSIRKRGIEQSGMEGLVSEK